jgi:hypothetical protein
LGGRGRSGRFVVVVIVVIACCKFIMFACRFIIVDRGSDRAFTTM